MSTENFDISEVYQKGLERGRWDVPKDTKWDNSAQDALSIVPLDSPESYVMMIKELWFVDNTIIFTETTPGQGLINIVYPNYDGGTELTIQIDDLADLILKANREETINSVKYQVIEFNPPVLLFNTKTKKTFSVTKHPNVTGVTSGDLTFIAKKIWTLKEADF